MCGKRYFISERRRYLDLFSLKLEMNGVTFSSVPSFVFFLLMKSPIYAELIGISNLVKKEILKKIWILSHGRICTDFLVEIFVRFTN